MFAELVEHPKGVADLADTFVVAAKGREADLDVTGVNGITDYFLTKLDVLSSLDTVPICVAYEVDGVRHDEMPMSQSDIHHAKPIYEEMPGWWEDISEARTFEELPQNAQNYVLRLEELSGAFISCIGVGPGRDETIVRREIVR